MAYAIIRSGGKQYRVSPGQTIAVERLEAEAGEKVTFEDIVLFADGTTVTAGDPIVSGAKVTGEVIEQFRDKKVIAFKYRIPLTDAAKMVSTQSAGVREAAPR